MGFRSVTVLQESVGATFGAGVSMSTVVDIGAQKTSIACVEDGMIIESTRLHLPFGGDDISKFFLDLLMDVSFPYQSFNLNSRLLDESLASDLKERYCTNNESDLAVNLYDFYVRGPGNPTLHFKFKVYDEVLLAPLVRENLFNLIVMIF